MIRVNLTDQKTFDLRSPFNVFRDYEIDFASDRACSFWIVRDCIFFTLEFSVVEAQGRIRWIVVEMTRDEIKWSLNSWNRKCFIEKSSFFHVIFQIWIMCGFWITTLIILRVDANGNQTIVISEVSFKTQASWLDWLNDARWGASPWSKVMLISSRLMLVSLSSKETDTILHFEVE